MINSNGNNSRVDASVNNNEEVIEVDEDDVPNSLSRITQNETTCPIMLYFNMPFDNDQCINNLLVELLSNKEYDEGCFSMRKNNKEIVCSRAPKGASRSQLWMLNNRIKDSIRHGTNNGINNLQLRLKSSLRNLRNTYQCQFED